MFPLKERKIAGYSFGVPTSYSKFHLGVDYKSDYATLYAPFNGIISYQGTGVEGGMTLWLKPQNRPVVIRFLHLSQFLVKAGDNVAEGQPIAITGNTGHSTGPHLHLDISKNKVEINNTSNFLDPEKYDWEEMAVPTNQTKLVLGKDGKTVFKATPIATDFVNLKKQSEVEGIEVPNPIPPASSL